MIRRIRNCADLAALPAVIGGKLGIHGAANVGYSAGLLAAGYHAVFDASSGTKTFENYLRKFADTLPTAAIQETNRVIQ